MFRSGQTRTRLEHTFIAKLLESGKVVLAEYVIADKAARLLIRQFMASQVSRSSTVVLTLVKHSRPANLIKGRVVSDWTLNICLSSSKIAGTETGTDLDLASEDTQSEYSEEEESEFHVVGVHILQKWKLCRMTPRLGAFCFYIP